MKMKANKKAVLTALTALLLFVIFMSPSTVSAWTVSITADACAAPGGTVTVQVMAYNVTPAVPDLASANYNITFNASVVNVTDVATGSVNALPVTDWNFIAPDTVRILAMDPNTGHTGDVNIANITFEAVGGAGSGSSLSITYAQFTDYDITLIAPDAINNGTFHIATTEIKTIPETEKEPTPATETEKKPIPDEPGTKKKRIPGFEHVSVIIGLVVMRYIIKIKFKLRRGS